MTDPAEWIWAYLHNELAPEDKTRFEEALQNDATLRAALDEYRATHTRLKDLMPHIDEVALDNQKLEESLLAEWESEHPEYAETSADQPRRKILRFALPLAAAAAAAILLFALPSDPIRWQRTLYGSSPQLRGQSAAQPRYTQSDLNPAVDQLQKIISNTGQLTEQWNLQVSLQELADGALSVEVAGQPRRNRGFSRVWNENFQTLEDFRQKLPRFGKQIADDLTGEPSP